MNLPHFIYHAPATLEECFNILEKLGNDGKILAGGTDLVVRMKLRLVKLGHLVSIAKIADLDNVIYQAGKGLAIGAGTTLSRLALHETIKEKCPALACAADLVATKQIRNTATVGGNILQNTRCRFYNRSPVWGKAVQPCFKRNGKLCHVAPSGKRCFAVYQGDLAPLFVTLNATAILVSHTGTEEIPVESLFSGDGRRPFRDMNGKVLHQLVIPDHSLFMKSAYKKYRLRNGIDFPLAGVAVAVEMKNNLIDKLRICLTGVSSAPALVHGVEGIAIGKPLDKGLLREIGKITQAAAHPISNLEDDPSKRRFMVRILTEDILTTFNM